MDDLSCSQSDLIAEDIALVQEFYTEDATDHENKYFIEQARQNVDWQLELDKVPEFIIDTQSHGSGPTPTRSDIANEFQNSSFLIIPEVSDLQKCDSNLKELAQNTRNDITQASDQARESDMTDKSVTRILSFLKSVDSDQTTHSQSQEPVPLPIFDNVKQKIVNYQLEISQKSKTISALQQELDRLRQSTSNELQQSQNSHKSRLGLQRKEYEGIIKRHLGFIDKVLGEKEALTQKTVELSEKVLQMERQFNQKTMELEESHQRNLTRQREIWGVGEKSRREKWIQEKSKVIKEQTIQALEPEIQKLLANHKSALALAEENYKNLVAKEKNTLMEMHQIVLDQNREKYVLDRQKACEEEREFARQRYSKQLEREEMEV